MYPSSLTPTGELSGSLVSVNMARDSGALIPNDSCNWLPAVGNEDSSQLHAVNVVHAANRRERIVPFVDFEAGCLKLPPPKNVYINFSLQ